MKAFKIITGTALLALILTLAVLRIRDSRQTPSGTAGENRQGVAVRVARPGQETLKITRTFTGDLSGADQAVIYSEVPGRLQRYLVTEGEEVEKDQAIALVYRDVTGVDFEYHRVRSPIEGTVTRLYLGRGDTANQQTPLAVVANLDQIKGSFYIPERDLGYVSRGDKVNLRVSAWPERVFEGSVSRISLSLERATRSSYAEAVFENIGRLLKPGMFAEIQVISRRIEDAILLPEDAALRDHSQGYYYVYAVENGAAVKKEVQTGYSQDDIIQIKSGISVSDEVIVEGQNFIEDGDRVRVIR